jgi:hypothetical protein
MAGHSRPKDGVLSHAYVPAIHVFGLARPLKTWMPGTRPGMTNRNLPPLDIQIDIDGNVVGRFVPAADMAVDAGISQSIGRLR